MKAREYEESVKPLREAVWKTYKGRCVRCKKPANSVHELIPRSLAPNEWGYFANMVTLCRPCHKWAQEDTTMSAPILRQLADKFLEDLNTIS
jgi:5-methylcytosine-specific restriction endonuclease McrA